MGQVFEGIDDTLAAWIAAQPLFFVATAPLAGDGHVNLSPRGHNCLSILSPRRLAWVDLTGSGVETIAHLRENGRITLMWSAFTGRPRIVRVHGRGSVVLPGEPMFDQVVAEHPAHPSTRAVIVVDAERVSDSCGYGVPVMEVVQEREVLRLRAEQRGPDGMAAYRATSNAVSLDGLPGLDPASTAAPPLGSAATRGSVAPRSRGRQDRPPTVGT